jgi:hypothetical protein
MDSSFNRLHFGVVGDGPDATITAYGSAVAMGVASDSEQPKAWTCATCTFHNSETLGRFCAMCGGRRFADPRKFDDSSHSEGHSEEQGDTLGELHLLPGGSPRLRQSNNLEGSFSFLNLMDAPPLVNVPMPDSPQSRRTTLSEKDFQMSFANWSISDNGAWTCVSCTYVNTNALHLTCEVCESKRPKKNAANQSQKVMQDMFETSFRSGQPDFLRKQQEKIEEIEERVIAAERVDEIMEAQEDLMEYLNEEKKDTIVDGSVVFSAAEKAQLTQQWIDELEQVRRQEREEQQRMQEVVDRRRRELQIMERMASQLQNMERTASQRCLKSLKPSPIEVASSPQTKARAQERLLSQWKHSYKSQEPEIAAIRQRQQAIFGRLQGDL